MSPPMGYEQVVGLYGDPTPFVREDGTASPFWEMRMVKVALPGPLPLGWKPDSVVRFARFNQAIADEAAAAFEALRGAGVWDHVVTFDGAYAWRPQRGSHKLSMHAFGAAIDLNAGTNRLGEVGDMHPGIVEVFEGRGWTWGGRWHRPDPMHYQWGRDY